MLSRRIGGRPARASSPRRREAGHADDVEPIDERRFFGILHGQDERRASGSACRERDRHGPADRPHRPIERELADVHRARVVPRIQAARGPQQGDRDRQIEPRPVLRAAPPERG